MNRIRNMLTFGACLCCVADLGFGGSSSPTPPPIWGKTAHGLATSLAAEHMKVPAGQPIEVSFRIKNLSDKELVVWNCGFWPNHRLEVTDAAGAEVPLTQSGQLMKSAFAPTGPRRKNIAVRLAPGDIDVTLPKLDLRPLFKFGPGTYHLRCLYHDGEVQVWSNPLTIECQ